MYVLYLRQCIRYITVYSNEETLNLFKSFWNLERQLDEDYVVWYTTSALNPSLCVCTVYLCIQGGEPELAVDSERS